ncbi:MAG TPA: dienelactone hydrolase family protein [Anaeromyxobacteraceae bacterium]|nr:dienelactone hydrolase family protein [Anaeromyxobacteraceae bacterium]
MGKTISFPRTNGGTAQGYLAEAKDAKAPGVVVIQEWWGLQGQVKATCDRLAEAGFTALAPDLYDGKTIPYHDKPAASAAMGALDFKKATDEAVRGAAQFLKARGGKVGITGFCMGGAVTVIAAAHVPELSAAVCFYGLPPETVAAAKDVRVPIQCHFAAQDDWVTPAAADDFEKKLKAAGKTFEVHRYPGHHAFMNSDRKEVHDAGAARTAWDRALAWLRKYLA